MRLTIETIPPRDKVLLLDSQVFALSHDAFWFETPGGVRFHYRIDGSLLAENYDPALADEMELYLWGTAYGAIAWLHGLLPLHAGAVAADGHAVAFTGPSGAGKSTLAAAYCRQGGKLVCDDTLVVVPTKAGAFALPDGKPMKLWESALGLVEVTPSRPIENVPGKSYVEPIRSHDGPVLLTDLFFLEEGRACRHQPITGAGKLEWLSGALYRDFVHIARGDHALHARLLIETSRSVRFWRLERPLDANGLRASIGLIERSLERKTAP